MVDSLTRKASGPGGGRSIILFEIFLRQSRLSR